MDHRQICFCEGLGASSTASLEDLVHSVELRKLRDLMQASAFWACDRTLEGWAIALRHSHPIISAWDQDRLIGFGRATSDGIYRATIWDVAIDNDYRGEGLGRKLVQTLLAHPHMNRVERVSLMTTHQHSFYEGIGFERNTSTAMVLFQQSEPPPVLLEQQASQSNHSSD